MRPDHADDGRRRKRYGHGAEKVAPQELPRTKGRVFPDRVNRILEDRGFHPFAESACEKFYAVRGWPSVAPRVYFRTLLVGDFEDLTSERGGAWRCADSKNCRPQTKEKLREAIRQDADHPMAPTRSKGRLPPRSAVPD